MSKISWFATIAVVAVVAIFFVAKPTKKADKVLTLEDVREDTAEAFETARNFISQEQKNYLGQMEDEIDTLRERANALQRQASAEIEQGSSELVDSLEKKKVAAMKNLEAFRQSSKENVQAAKERFELALEDLQKGIDEAAERFSSESMSANPGEAANMSEAIESNSEAATTQDPAN